MKLRPVEPQPKIGRPGITDLPLPNRRFDLTITPNFETEEQVKEEDALRAAYLRRRARKVAAPAAEKLLKLADAIDPETAPHPTTPASSRYMRKARIRIIGAIWEMVDDR